MQIPNFKFQISNFKVLITGFSVLFFLFIFSVPPSNAKQSNPKSTKPAQVADIRYWSNPTYTRVVISLTKETKFESRLLKEDPSIEKPRRLYIDLKDASLSPNLKQPIPINDGLLKMARAGQYSKDVVRVVLDIESIEDYKIFPLEGRIVIDVMGKGHAKQQKKEKPEKQEKPQKQETPQTVVKEEKPAIAKLKIGKIVLDAGHGGHDPGAIGRKGLQEKDITLKIVKGLKTSIENEFDTQVILTRDDDTFIELPDRTAIANTKNADIFVSVHVNASFNREASGVETYYLDLTNDKVAMRLAARENAVSEKKMSDLQYILNDLIKTAKHNESTVLASNIQESLVSTLRQKYNDVKGNGIKGAPFYVLVGTHMPAVLVEVSFISNLKEEARLKDDGYIDEIVKGITSGIKAYVKEMGTSE